MASSKSRGPQRPPQQAAMRATTGSHPRPLAPAIAAARAGKLAEAKLLCEAVRPASLEAIEALHLSSVIAASMGDLDAAIAGARRVIERQPGHAEAQRNLGAILAQQGR